jgi:hypothetical protein
LETAKLRPCVIVTDSEPALHARLKSPVPIAFLVSPEDSTAEFVSAHPQIDLHAEHAEQAGQGVELAPLRSRSPSGEIASGAYRLRLPAGFEREEAEVLEALSLLTKRVQLAEPFARIHDAIREAQRIGGRGTDANEQAA